MGSLHKVQCISVALYSTAVKPSTMYFLVLYSTADPNQLQGCGCHFLNVSNFTFIVAAELSVITPFPDTDVKSTCHLLIAYSSSCCSHTNPSKAQGCSYNSSPQDPGLGSPLLLRTQGKPPENFTLPITHSSPCSRLPSAFCIVRETLFCSSWG